MNPNNVNRFESAAVGINRARSKFHRPSKVLSSFRSGVLVPFYVDEVLPGDNFELKLKALCRMTTPAAATMDNAFLDLYAFYVPNRIIWDNWKKFMGETTDDYWTNDEELEVPQINFGQNTHMQYGRKKDIDENTDYAHDLLSYLGVPPIQDNRALVVNSSESCKVNALPVRAYCQIWNDYFRDQNTQLPIHLNKGDDPYSSFPGTNYNPYATSYVDGCETGSKLAPVNKFKDYFTSALPQAQRGQAVQLPLGQFAPVVARDEYTIQNHGVSLGTLNNIAWSKTGVHGLIMGINAQTTNGIYNAHVSVDNDETADVSNAQVVAPNNLWTDLASATASTVNQLRLAFQTQKYLETLARSGSRYIESLYSLYGVQISDKTIQRAEYLGGMRTPINITSVAQTSETGTTPQGTIGAYSVTGLEKAIGNHFFEEHGILMIVGCVRAEQSYCQGYEPLWSRKSRFDYYAPVFANLGEMPIYNKEIYFGGVDDDEGVFGYKEAWAEYRFKPNKCTGLMMPFTQNSLSVYNYANNFESVPTLTTAFMCENPELIDRTLAIADTDQFIIDLYVDNYTTRVMPMYSVPGLIDHA